MKWIYGLGCTILLALIFIKNVHGNCSKTSAFRYEFENWLRRYILEVIDGLTEGIEHTYYITLTEIELEKEQEIDFRNTLNEWRSFRTKVTAENHKSKAELDQMVKEFRLKCNEFDVDKSILGNVATKNMLKVLDGLENVTEAISAEYVEDILQDWKEFYTEQDYETLAQQKDCEKIDELIKQTEKIENKTEALNKLSLGLLENFGMQDWKNVLPMPNEFSMY